MNSSSYGRVDIPFLVEDAEKLHELLADQVRLLNEKSCAWLISLSRMHAVFYKTLTEYYEKRILIVDVVGYEAWLPGIGFSGKIPLSV